MSFALLNPIDNTVIKVYSRDTDDYFYELEASRNIWVEPLTFGRIPHRVNIRKHGLVTIMRAPGVFMSQGILVDQGPIDIEKDIYTGMFNLNHVRVLVHEGDIISRLVAL